MLRRSLKILAACAALGAMFWIAAPALSTTPYIPSASDFEQRLPQLDRVAARTPLARSAEAANSHGKSEGRVRFISPPITAPERFDLVGIPGADDEVEFRVRDGEEDWSDWYILHPGDPLYTGGSDQVQVRSRGPMPEGKLHYVNVSGDTSMLSGLLSDVRGAINTAVIGTFGDTAVASSPKPQFIKRSAWGANKKRGGCQPRVKPAYGKVKAAAVHHTVSVDNYSEAQAPGIVLGICRYHRNGNGWNDIGYNALVDRFGNVYQGRKGGMARPVIGAQAEGHNSQTAGVAVIGNRSKVRPSGAERRGLVSYLAWRLDKAGINAQGKATLRSAGGSTTITPKNKKIRVKRIFGHRDTNYTECPGNYLYADLGKIRRKTAARMEQFADDDSGNTGGGTGKRKRGGGKKHKGKGKHRNRSTGGISPY